MYNNEITTRRRPMTKNEIKNFKVWLNGKTFKFAYSVDSLNEILNSDVFDKVQIPVYVHNSILFGEGKKGISVVGNILSYNDETGEIKIKIFAKFVSKVNGIANAIVFPRVAEVLRTDGAERAEDSIVEDIKILGFDIVSEERLKDL